MNKIRCKRIYEPSADTDGFRILVDRLWPRGIKKQNAEIDLWAKEIAPSSELRKWFSHEPARFNAFKKQYMQELDNNSASRKLVDVCRQEIRDHHVTLLYAAKMNNTIMPLC